MSYDVKVRATEGGYMVTGLPAPGEKLITPEGDIVTFTGMRWDEHGQFFALMLDGEFPQLAQLRDLRPAPHPTPAAFGDRLRQAIAHAGYSQRGACTAMEEMGVAGASYANLRRILKGNTEKAPSLDFVEQVADCLMVRRAWLAFGDGAMREADQ